MPSIKHVDDIIKILAKNEIFLHLKMFWNSSCSSITDKFLKEQIVRYSPSKIHRKKCKDDLCHINARLEFIDYNGVVFNSKSFKEEEEHRKECKDDLCDMNDKLEVIDHRRRITKSFRQKKCTVL